MKSLSTMRNPGLSRVGYVGLIAAGLFFASPARAADAEVTIDNFTFSPQTLTIKAGTKVTWKNQDDIPHTVASTTKAFKSPALDTNENYSFVFSSAGKFDYFCSLHPHMTGTIAVEPEADGAINK